MTTLRNDFHGTAYQTPKSREVVDRIIDRMSWGHASEAERAWARKVRKTLCGMSDCQCANNILGERGSR